MKRVKRCKFKEHKIVVLGMIFFILLIAFVAIPTLSSYKNRTLSQNITVWDGTIAENYRSGEGTEENPYIIANGEELAYFASQLEITNYDGVYFKLSNNIVLNEGIFNYNKTDGLKYIKDNDEVVITSGLENSVVNEFYHLNNFKGTFDGDYYTIFGIYIDDLLDDGQNALFTNLEGNVKNLYIENSVIYGGKVVAGVASKANNATLTNILYDGFVISNEEVTTNTVEKSLEDVTLNSQGIELNEILSIDNLEYIPGLVTEVTLSGTTNDFTGILKINDLDVSAGDFEITLGEKLLKDISINYQSDIESEINLTKLKYIIKYNYSNAAGIISISENTTLQNIVNKSSVSAAVEASGIVNFVNGATVLKNVYNVGNIVSDNRSSGLISGINQNKEDTTIINCYNVGELSSNNNSMIGNIEYNVGKIKLENSFNPQDNYVIDLIKESTVLVNNSYVVTSNYINSGNITGEFIETTPENLKDKTFVLSNLLYKEFNEDNNAEDLVWVFEDSSYPELFIDYSVANIYIGEYKWDNYQNTLNKLMFSKSFIFNIKASSDLNTISKIYYYVNNSDIVLTKDELDKIDNWTEYENIVEMNDNGIYVIYAKIVDINGSVSYINTDLIMLDLVGASVTISTSTGSKVWESLTENLSTYYIDDTISLVIDADDLLSGVKEIYYYKTDKNLSLEELKNIENWEQYKEDILIEDKKTIIYAKVIDNCDNVVYVNSDLIIMNGYTLNSIYSGMSGETTDNLYITKNSSVSLKFTYQDVIEYSGNDKHQLISNTLLPENTILTIIDKIYNKVYVYTTTNEDYGYDECIDNNCYATYDFTLFNEVGTTNKFQESSYTDIINEEFIINISFKNTEITENLDSVKVWLNLFNETEEKSTIKSTIKDFNVNVLSDAYFTLTSQFEDVINYNENAKYVIDFSTKLNYKYLNNYKIYDTSFEDKAIGLAIKLLSPNDEVVEKKYLKNFLFLLGDKKYSPSSDGIVRIKLDSGISDITDDLIIQTFKDNSELEKGDYKFEISLYAAYDGVYSNEYLEKIEIPVYVGENTYKNNINFNVLMSDEDKIITTDSNEFNFDFLLNDDALRKFNVKVSLYKKNLLKATDQNYTIIDLGNYVVSPVLEKFDDNIYYVSKDVKNNDKLSININTGLLEKNGYMFVFELYEDDKIVSKVSKKFIVK